MMCFFSFLRFTTKASSQTTSPLIKANKSTFESRTTSEFPEVSDSKCHILSLPRELRDMIYEYAIVAPTPVPIRETTTKVNRARDFKSKVHGHELLRTCKQIHDETQDILYKKSTFMLRFDYSHADPRSKCNILFNIMHGVVNSRIPMLTMLHSCKCATSFLNIYAPMEKIDKLELRVMAPPGLAIFSLGQIHVFDALTSYIAIHLPECLERCKALKKLRIVVSGWDKGISRDFVDGLMQDLSFPGEDTEYVQQGGDALWLSEKAKDNIKLWMKAGKKVDFVVEGNDEA